MLRQCCICKKIYGRKEPFSDPSITHGYCGPCTISELEKIEQYLQQNKKENSK